MNVLPRDDEDFAAGKGLFARWAAEVTSMGGAVSAEHGVGKIKRGFLKTMYGARHIQEMAALKLELDPAAQLGRGNLFGEDLLDAMRVEKGEAAGASGDAAAVATPVAGEVAPMPGEAKRGGEGA